MRYIDLRSDTVTMPTEEMRIAMANAPVGDDVYGDDPTVSELEKIAAQMVGKEAALFVPSGTFGNQLALLTHTRRGDEVILEHNAHIVIHEVGAAAVIAGVQLRTIHGKNGTMDPILVEKSIRPDDIHMPKTGLICVEEAHGCGAVVPVENLKAIKEIANRHNIPVHMDGARVFNAATALKIDVKEITENCDTVMFCLSKGLCAPVGSILAGPKEFIDIARKNRKLMGGGLRQAGIIAAAGIIALEKMTVRLNEDHKNADYMAEKLSEINGINIDFSRRDINMVFFTINSGLIEDKALVDSFLDAGIKINGIEDGEYRFVTNNDVTKEDIDFAVNKLIELLK